MTNPASVVQPAILIENKMTIHSFLKQSYDQARKQVEESITFINDGVSFIKDEFSGFYNKAGDRFNRMLLPANNFLKDLSQIETELQKEIQQVPDKEQACAVVPIEIALLSPLEENY